MTHELLLYGAFMLLLIIFGRIMTEEEELNMAL